MRVTIDDGNVRRDIEDLKTTIPAGAQEASRAALKKLMEDLKERIVDLIPDKGGWYDLYKDSIKIVEINPDHYELTTTIADIKYGDILADSSLIWISGSEPAARVLGQHNPWTLDTIPAIEDGLKAEMLVRPASESEINTFRARRISELNEIKRVLALQDIKVLEFNPELPKINGRIMADVPFLAKRLEYGLGGFPRTPVWTRINEQGEIVSKSKAVEDRGHTVFSKRWWKGRNRPVGRDG